MTQSHIEFSNYVREAAGLIEDAISQLYAAKDEYDHDINTGIQKTDAEQIYTIVQSLSSHAIALYGLAGSEESEDQICLDIS